MGRSAGARGVLKGDRSEERGVRTVLIADLRATMRVTARGRGERPLGGHSSDQEAVTAVAEAEDAETGSRRRPEPAATVTNADICRGIASNFSGRRGRKL